MWSVVDGTGCGLRLLLRELRYLEGCMDSGGANHRRCHRLLLPPRSRGIKMNNVTLARSNADRAATAEKVRSISKSRVQLDLTPRAMALLTELKEKTDAATYAEVFKNAMKLYD